MHNEDSEIEVFLVPVGDDVVLAVPTSELEQQASESRAGLASLFGKANPLIAAAMGHSGDVKGRGAALFEMSTESYRKYEDARLDEVGTYFRGVLRTSKGQASHQVQLREVQQTQVPIGFDTFAAAQMAAIQAQLDRIKDTLADLTVSVSEVMQFLEEQQQAEIEAALRVIRNVHDRAKRTRAISDTDWTRITGLEHVLEKQLIAVRKELDRRLKSRVFGGTPEADRKQMEMIEPDRVAELVKAHRLLVGGLRGWNELLVLRKYQMGELGEEEVLDVKTRLKELRAQQDDVLDAVDLIVSPENETRPRSRLQRLFKDGIVLGARNDAHNLVTIAAGRETLKNVGSGEPRSLSSASPLKVLVLPDGEGATRPSDVGPTSVAAGEVEAQQREEDDSHGDDLHHK